MKKLIELTFETKIKTTQEELFLFHTDTNNLPKITLPDTKVEIIKLEFPMKKGNIVVLDITKLFLTQRWEVEIREFEEYFLIKDYGLKSPFSYFEHDHIFKKFDDKSSILCDRVKFSLPFYPFSNFLLPFIKKDIKKMFEYRHKKTKEILESTQSLFS